MTDTRPPKTIAKAQNSCEALRKPIENATMMQSGQIVVIDDCPVDAVPALGSSKYSRVSTTKRAKCDALPQTLDGFRLLKLCRVESPDEVAHAVLSKMHIADVVAEDLRLFTNLTRLDMSSNEAPLEPFGWLPALVELDFQCNALKKVTHGNGFQNLEVLNLSYNCLGSKDVGELSNMLRIRELYLGSNHIRSIPPIMDRFSRLETLSLENNNISGQGIFSSLNIMPRLKNLDLSYNKITGFPESALTLENDRGTGFYNLMNLNLAHNMIINEEAVVHTSELRSLRKLILYGNPFTQAAVTIYDPTKLVYNPVPSLTNFLSERTTDKFKTTILVAYPELKKKKMRSISCNEHVEIYKMIPVLQPPFRTRATEFFQANNVTKHELLSERQSDSLPTHAIKRECIEEVLMGTGSSNRILPAMSTRIAVNALRYQLEHPLTSHDDIHLYPARSQQLTQAFVQRKRPRRPLPPRKKSQTLLSQLCINDSVKSKGNARLLHSTLDSQGVCDALTKQVSSTWDRRPNKTEQKVDKALDSIITTAKMLNLINCRSP